MLFLLIQASWCKQYLALLIIASLNTVENKIHDVSNLDKRKRKRNKKTEHDAKKKRHWLESKCITTDDYSKFTKDIVANNIKSK